MLQILCHRPRLCATVNLLQIRNITGQKYFACTINKQIPTIWTSYYPLALALAAGISIALRSW
jgi:hypothetical protein